eukprot:330871_1
MFAARNRNDEDDTIRTVKCVNPHITATDWNNTLIEIDEYIMELYDKAQEAGIIIISSPYNLKEIRLSLIKFTHTNFKDASIINCFEIVLNFLNPNKKNIEDSISESKTNHSNSKFSIQKYNELIETCAIIVINTLNCDFVSLPRSNSVLQTSTDTINTLWHNKTDFTGVTLTGYLCDNGEIITGDILRQKPGQIFVHFHGNSATHFGKKYNWINIPNERIYPPPSENWGISWNQLDYKNVVFSHINDNIFENLLSKYFNEYTMGSQNNFSISTKVYPAQDWSKKIDFENGKDIGYLCDDGEIIRGNVLAKDNKRIFVKFNCRNAYRSYGQLEDWIHIPNERICPPPKIQITNYIPTNMFNDIFNPNIWTTDIPTSGHDQDEDLQRAIAESLGQIYNINNSLESNHQDIFQAQKEVCYEEAVNLLLNGECCFGLYDKKIKKWRTAVF